MKAMKQLQFKRLHRPEKRYKSMGISQVTKDEECVTEVDKSFVYYVSQSQEEEPITVAPEVHIKKTKKKK